MKVEVSARHDGISERAKRYAEEKISKLDRFFERITSAKVILDTDAEYHRAEIILAAGGGATIVGESTDAQSLFAAIDMAVDKLERQVKKHKEKLVSRNRKRNK